LGLSFEVACREETSVRKALGEIVEDRRHFGQRPAVDEQGRNFAFGVQLEVSRRVLFALGKRYPPALEIDADLMRAMWGAIELDPGDKYNVSIGVSFESGGIVNRLWTPRREPSA